MLHTTDRRRCRRHYLVSVEAKVTQRVFENDLSVENRFADYLVGCRLAPFVFELDNARWGCFVCLLHLLTKRMAKRLRLVRNNRHLPSLLYMGL